METTAPAPSLAQPRGTGRIVASVLIGLFALALIAAGGAGLYARIAASDHGWITTGSHRYATDGRAIVSGSLDVDQIPDWLVAKVRVKASSADGKPIFVGVAKRADVDRYLDGVAHSTLDDVNFGPFDPTYTQTKGSSVPAPPAAQHFWVESNTGNGTQSVSWKIRSGHWRVVVMNADASPNVAADAKVGTWIRGALAIAIAALGVGVLLAAAAVAVGVRRT
jgi:hypothetical protein